MPTRVYRAANTPNITLAGGNPCTCSVEPWSSWFWRSWSVDQVACLSVFAPAFAMRYVCTVKDTFSHHLHSYDCVPVHGVAGFCGKRIWPSCLGSSSGCSIHKWYPSRPSTLQQHWCDHIWRLFLVRLDPMLMSVLLLGPSCRATVHTSGWCDQHCSGLPDTTTFHGLRAPVIDPRCFL